MLDISDDDAIDVPPPETSVPSDQGDSAADEDTEMVDDIDPVPIKTKPRKKKEKKIIPVGHNGLKKRRLVKSRTTTDDKGYMVTEDYSSYESVDESEAVEETKAKKSASAKPKKTLESSNAKPKAGSKAASSTRKSNGTKAAQGGLMNFFSKKS